MVGTCLKINNSRVKLFEAKSNHSSSPRGMLTFPLDVNSGRTEGFSDGLITGTGLDPMISIDS
jgi:hypothetical protein